MINWNEVDEMKERYESYCAKVRHLSELEPLSEPEAITINLDHGRLIHLLNQFRPHPFDPEDRGTWPEIGEWVLVEWGAGFDVWKIGPHDIIDELIWWTRSRDRYQLKAVKTWTRLEESK